MYPSVREEIRHLLHSPVRVWLEIEDRPVARPGLLARVGERTATLELMEALPVLLRDARIVVEILHTDALYRIACLAQSDTLQPGRLLLSHPETVEMIQRRTHPRAATAIPVEFWPREAEAAATPWSGHAVNLSSGGTAVVTATAPARGKRVSVRFLHPVLKNLGVLTAMVMRIQPGPGQKWTVALSFQDLVQEQAYALACFIEQERKTVAAQRPAE